MMLFDRRFRSLKLQSKTNVGSSDVLEVSSGKWKSFNFQLHKRRCRSFIVHQTLRYYRYTFLVLLCKTLATNNEILRIVLRGLPIDEGCYNITYGITVFRIFSPSRSGSDFKITTDIDECQWPRSFGIVKMRSPPTSIFLPRGL